jgi:hypothetical protein
MKTAKIRGFHTVWRWSGRGKPRRYTRSARYSGKQRLGLLAITDARQPLGTEARRLELPSVMAGAESCSWPPPLPLMCPPWTVTYLLSCPGSGAGEMGRALFPRRFDTAHLLRTSCRSSAQPARSGSGWFAPAGVTYADPCVTSQARGPSALSVRPWQCRATGARASLAVVWSFRTRCR